MRTRASAANPTATGTVTKTETIAVGDFPACDYHLERAREYVSAYFVGVTIFETQAYMCATCFNLYGMGLGPGKGQILLMGA
jgi:hypothetical protein